MNDQLPTSVCDGPAADPDPRIEAVDEVLSAILGGLNSLMFDLLHECIQRTHERGITPTVKDVAYLQAKASRTLHFWVDGGFRERQEHRRLVRARQMSGVAVEPLLPGTEAHYTNGRDLAVWFSPLAGTPDALTTGQAAYICEQEAFRRFDRVVEEVLAGFAGTDPGALELVGAALGEHREWWTSPTYERRGEQVRCEHCLVELTHLNTAEVGNTDECVMCRGWLTSEQRRKQRVARLMSRLPAPR